ncbi:MAG: TonB-dependent receptor [Steroidobacteraceae bacterium]
MNGQNIGTWLAAAGLTAMASITPAQAADTVTTVNDSAPSGGELEEVLVTATRRTERAQDVPIAVQAISAEDFAKSNYKNPTDIQYLSPSVQVSASGGIGFNVRGVGTNSFNAATEQTVGLVVDGVVQGFVDNIGGDLNDASSIEVLRGPQGTQFGKNASAGVINITTARPNFDAYSTKAHLAYGNYNDTNASVTTNLPLSSTVAASLAGSYQNRDGWSYNPVKGKNEGDSDQMGFKGKLLWNVDDDLSAYLIASYRKAHISPNFLSTYRYLGQGYGSTPPGFGVLDYGITPGPDNTETAISSDSYRYTTVSGTSLQLDQKLGDYTLTSLTAFMHQKVDTYATLGGTPIVYMEGPSLTYGNQFSQELRLTSPEGQRFQYVGGLYYYRRSSDTIGLMAGPWGGTAEALYGDGARISSSGGEDHSSYTVQSVAAFADGTIKLNDQWSVIVGGRETYDDAESFLYTVHVDDVYKFSGWAINAPGHAHTTNDNFSYRTGLKYTVSPDLMAYLTVASGYKGPLAISVAGSGARIVDPETNHSIELGMKSDWLNNSLIFNADVYYEKFKNFQTTVMDTTLVPASFVLGNAGGMRTQGAEVELTVKPLQRLELSTNVAYQDAEFTDFLTSCYSSYEPIPMATTTDPSAVGACYTIPGTTTSYTQAKGKPLPNASKWNITERVGYSRPVSANLVVDGQANYLYRSAFYTNGADPNTRISPYGIVNVNAGISNAAGTWRVGVFARNLFDKYYISAIETGIFDTGGLVNVLNPEAKRTVGVSLDVSL